MESTPTLFFKNGLWHKQCAVCPKYITNKYRSQIRQRTCSHSCQLKGNKYRKGHKPSNAFKSEDVKRENNPNWRGDGVGYFALHDWVYRTLGRPMQCENCGSTDHKRYEWANLSGEYKRDTSDWARLCKMCHHLMDGSMRGLNRKGGTTGRKWKS